MVKKIRLGMVGYGFRGPGLFGMARSVEQLEPVAVCARKPEPAARVKTDFPEAACYDNYEKMLDAGAIDAVVIETPPMTHAALAIAALERNIHVLSDVPVLHTMDEVEPLWGAAKASQAIYMFGSTANYFGFVETCSDLKDKGLLGKPFYLEADYVHDLTEFSKMTPWRMGYEPVRYCTHSLGPLLKWLGKELVSVSCFDTGSHVRPENKDSHDAMVAIFRTASHEVVKLLVSFANTNTAGQHRYLCHGTEGTFECTWPLTGEEPNVTFSTRSLYGLDKAISLPVSSARPEIATLENLSGHGPLDYAMFVDFVTAIRGGPCELDLKQGLRMTLPGLAALESARHGGRVTEINYPW